MLSTIATQSNPVKLLVLDVLPVSRDTFGQEHMNSRDYFNKLKLRYIIQYKANYVNSKNDKREIQMVNRSIQVLKEEIQNIRTD